MLKHIDVLSLHLPLTPETTGMIDAAAFAAMKRGGVLVNTARGQLVDGAALFEALMSGHLRGAGLDVFAREPVSTDDALLKLQNVVVTPQPPPKPTSFGFDFHERDVILGRPDHAVV